MAAAPGALHHRGVGIGVLPGGADPEAHPLAVALVQTGGGEARVVVDFLLFHAHQREDHRAVLGEHLLVGGEVAGGKDDCLLADKFHIAAVGALGDDAGHAALVVVLTDELLGHRVVEELHAGVLRMALQALDRALLAGGDHGVVALGVEGVGIVGAAVKVVVALKDDLQPVLGDNVDQPVHGLFGVVVAAVPLLLVDLEGGGTHLVIEEIIDVKGLDAVRFHNLAVLGKVGAAAGNGVAGAGEQSDAGAVLSGRESGRQTGHAGADDDNVVLDDLGDLILGDRGGRDLKVPFLQGFLGVHGLGGIFREGGAAAHSHDGQARRTGGRALQKVPA